MITTGTHRRQDHREGILAKTIEEQTAKLPSDTFLWAATASIATSLALKISVTAIGGSLMLHMMGRKEDSHFVGQWVPTLLIFGLYNKLVKQLGSDRTENPL